MAHNSAKEVSVFINRWLYNKPKLTPNKDGDLVLICYKITKYRYFNIMNEDKSEFNSLTFGNRGLFEYATTPFYTPNKYAVM